MKSKFTPISIFLAVVFIAWLLIASFSYNLLQLSIILLILCFYLTISFTFGSSIDGIDALFLIKWLETLTLVVLVVEAESTLLLLCPKDTYLLTLYSYSTKIGKDFLLLSIYLDVLTLAIEVSEKKLSFDCFLVFDYVYLKF